MSHLAINHLDSWCLCFFWSIILELFRMRGILELIAIISGSISWKRWSVLCKNVILCIMTISSKSALISSSRETFCPSARKRQLYFACQISNRFECRCTLENALLASAQRGRPSWQVIGAESRELVHLLRVVSALFSRNHLKYDVNRQAFFRRGVEVCIDHFCTILISTFQYYP